MVNSAVIVLQYIEIAISQCFPHHNPNHSAIIALGEGWAYHMGRVIADQRYGTNATPQTTQPERGFGNAGGVGAHLRALENFDPNLAADFHRWIPQGLMLDLNDANNENAPVIDRVNGYTNAQFFNALDSDVRNVPDFRLRLLQENGNRQQPQVTDLFTDVTQGFSQFSKKGVLQIKKTAFSSK